MAARRPRRASWTRTDRRRASPQAAKPRTPCPAIEDWLANGFAPEYRIDWLRAAREWLRDLHCDDGLMECFLHFSWVLVGSSGGCGDFVLVREVGRPKVAFSHMPTVVGNVEERIEPSGVDIVVSSIDVYNLLERLLAQSVGLDEAFDIELFEGKRQPHEFFAPSATDTWHLQDEETEIAILPPFSWADVPPERRCGGR